MFAIEFISFTVQVAKSVVDSIIGMETDDSAANSATANGISELDKTNALAVNMDESRCSEIVNQTMNKMMENASKESAAVDQNLITVNIAVSQTDQTFNNIAKKEPITEYEEKIIRDYYLRYYYGADDYKNFKLKTDWIGRKLEKNNEHNLTKKFQEDLLKDRTYLLRKEELMAEVFKKERYRKK